MRRRAALLLALVLVGCQSTTELVVRVDSDLTPGAQFRTASGVLVSFALVRFKLEMLPFGEPIDQPQPEPLFRDYVQLRTSDTPDGATLPIELGVVARGDWRGRALGIEARGQAAESDVDSDRPYIYTRALARFVEGEVALVSVRLLGACSVDAGTTPACHGDERCVLDAAGSGTTCEPTPIDETPPRYTAPTASTR